MRFNLLLSLQLLLLNRGNAYFFDDKGQDYRDLNERTLRRVQYQARIKHVLGVFCTGTEPVLRISCPNGGSLSITGTSKDEIVFCDIIDSSNAECIITCGQSNNNDNCESQFITDSYEDNVWASVYFSCQASDLTGTAATFTYDSGRGSCAASDSLFLDNFNYHIAELGTLCTTSTTQSATRITGGVGSNRKFMFGNHQLLECRDADTSVFVAPFGAENDYACITGRNCDFQFCEFEFLPLILETSMENIDEENCVEAITVNNGDSDDSDGKSLATRPETKPAPLPSGDYTTYYEARWSHVIEDTFCHTSLPVVQISCEDGGEFLLDAVTQYDSIECDYIHDNLVECMETCTSCNHFVGHTTFSDGPQPTFSGIRFECHGVELAHTTAYVTYLESNTTCDSYLTSFWPSYHYLELGVLCGNDDVLAYSSRIVGRGDDDIDDYYSFADRVVECSGVYAKFDSGDLDGHYQCYTESLNTGEESFHNALVPAVTMKSEHLREVCFPSTPVPTTPSSATDASTSSDENPVGTPAAISAGFAMVTAAGTVAASSLLFALALT